MVRIWIKECEENKEDKLFREKAERLGADYIEEDYMVFIKPKVSRGCDEQTAIALYKNGKVQFGGIEESCKNFTSNINYRVPETQMWTVSILQHIIKDRKR